jgi:hypothetical protein
MPFYEICGKISLRDCFFHLGNDALASGSFYMPGQCLGEGVPKTENI